MKNRFCVILLIAVAWFSLAASCEKNKDNFDLQNMTRNKITIKVGSKVFVATLADNNSAKAFQKLLPLTLNMVELNGNEKYFQLSNGLPVNAANPGTIQNGDLMLYGSNTFVLFYKSFSTSYSYTRLGKVEDVSGFAEALGAGDVVVGISLN